MQCRVCGRAVADDDRFCTGCGAQLGSDDTTTVLSAVDEQRGDRTPDDDSRTSDEGPADPGDQPQPGPAAASTATDVESDVDLADIAPTQPLSVVDPVVDPVVDEIPTQPIASVDPPLTDLVTDTDADDGWGDSDPVWAATGPVGRVTPIVEAESLARTESIVAAAPTADPAGAHPTAVVTTPTAPSTAEIPMMPAPIRERRGFRFNAVFGLSVLGSIVTMIAAFATIVTVSSNDRIVGGENTPANFRTGSWIPSDLADNLPIAVLIAVAAMMCGGVAAGWGWRGGSGLAAGAGLAVAGLAALTVGLAQIPIDAAYEMAAIPTDERFTLTITRDLGYWLQIAAAAIGIIVFFASLNDAFGDQRPGLNPWIAALGALSGLVMAAGPLIPEGLAVVSDNWYVTEGPGEPPAMLLSTRIVQLVLLALTSVIGFLSVRRWGLGVAAGGALPALWLTVSTLFELTDHPVGPGFRNPGATDITVHGVTIIGASALAAFLILAIVAAYDQAQHQW